MIHVDAEKCLSPGLEWYWKLIISGNESTVLAVDLPLDGDMRGVANTLITAGEGLNKYLDEHGPKR